MNASIYLNSIYYFLFLPTKSTAAGKIAKQPPTMDKIPAAIYPPPSVHALIVSSDHSLAAPNAGSVKNTKIPPATNAQTATKFKTPANFSKALTLSKGKNYAHKKRWRSSTILFCNLITSTKMLCAYLKYF